jgi:hypothetical protein
MLVPRRHHRIVNWHPCVLAAALAGEIALGARTSKAAEPATATIDKAHWLEQRGRNEEAIELLRRVSATQPDDETLVVARAEAYRADKNPFWALKVLDEYLSRHPNACEARVYAARVHLGEANLDQAAQLLDAPPCEAREELRLRMLLLRAELAELRGERSRVVQNIELARSIRRRFVEDDARLARLSAHYDPHHEPVVKLRLDVGAGWTSQATGALPLDLPTAQYRSASLMAGLDLWGRILPQARGDARPFIDVELHLARFLEKPALDLSSERPMVRGGVMFGRGKRRFSAAIAADWIHLDRSYNPPVDETSLHALGQRLEFRFDLAPAIQTYATLGRREFWNSDRDRLETEFGISKGWAISDTLTLATGVESRIYRAETRPFDQVGGTLRGQLDIAMPKQFALRETIEYSDDRFPGSRGYFEAHRRRHDRLLRVGARVASPRWLGILWALGYSYAYRDSTASDYDFSDHRLLALASWQTDNEQLGVKGVPTDGRVPMQYPDDVTQPGAKTQTEIVEVIRQDQAQQQSGSCMK